MIFPSNRRKFFHRRGGFTLVEMMIVVAVIAICAALAAPSIIRVQEQARTQKDALSVLTLVQDAQARARGRGAAVQLRVNSNYIVMTESRQDVDGDGTPDLPLSSCAATVSPTLKFFTSSVKEGQALMTMVHSAADVDGDGASDDSLLNGATDRYLCFTPHGRTFLSIDGVTWKRQEDVISFQFGNDSTSVVRTVDLFPGGNSRLHI